MVNNIKQQGKRPAKALGKHYTAPVSKPRQAKPIAKSLHPRNLHNNGYDFDALKEAYPELSAFVGPNLYGNTSIDFANPKAVKWLNAALLAHHYQIKAWDIPQGYLCPPIPGRVDYLHYAADLLGVADTKSQNGKVNDSEINALDIGTGANGIYPLLGMQVYGWQFVASDIDTVSLANVAEILKHNPGLLSKLQLRQQDDPQAIFKGIIKAGESFDISICNPPFHRSLAEAAAGSQRKVANLAANRSGTKPSKTIKQAPSKPALNFGGQKAELWCEGGEQAFLIKMITESADFAKQCLWFTSLVSKSENLKPCYSLLDKVQAVEVKTIEMQQGNKITRILAWSFLTSAERLAWQKRRDYPVKP
jgi:23S rRNA (adenine1618-N6)-methyltransferase